MPEKDLDDVLCSDPEITMIEIGPAGHKEMLKAKHKFDAMYAFCFFCGKPAGPAKDMTDLVAVASERGLHRFRLPKGFLDSGYDGERFVCQRHIERCRYIASLNKNVVSHE